MKKKPNYCKYQLRSRRAFDAFHHRVFRQCVSLCEIWIEIFETRKHLTTSLAERILLFLIFFCCFPLSDHSECVVCVFAQLKLVPNNSLSDPDCYGILWLYWDRDGWLWQVLYARCDRCHRYVLATTDGNDKMCVLGQIITRHWKNSVSTFLSAKSTMTETSSTKMASRIPFRTKDDDWRFNNLASIGYRLLCCCKWHSCDSDSSREMDLMGFEIRKKYAVCKCNRDSTSH